MGYCMEQANSRFTIKAENKLGALQALRKLDVKTASGDHFSWMNGCDPSTWKCLGDAMADWRYEIDDDGDDEDITQIEFTGEKLGSDTFMFNAIAPFVEPHSFIEMHGEDGAMWRWVFDGKCCREVDAEVRWDEE